MPKTTLAQGKKVVLSGALKENLYAKMDLLALPSKNVPKKSRTPSIRRLKVSSQASKSND